jgi:hypothetical protein
MSGKIHRGSTVDCVTSRMCLPKRCLAMYCPSLLSRKRVFTIRCLTMDYSVTILCAKNSDLSCGLFNDALSISDYKASDGRIIIERFELTLLLPNRSTDPAFAWKPQKPQTGWAWPRFETKAPTIQM